MAPCTIRWCGKYSQTSNFKKDGLTFHRYPTDPNIKNMWLKATKRQNWYPSKFSLICSRHFEEHCFINMKNNRRRLISSAIPTKFLPILTDSVEDQSIANMIPNIPTTPKRKKVAPDQPGPSRSPAPQDFWDGRVSPITDPEDDEAEVMAEPVCGDGEPIMAADPLTTQSSVEGSSKELQSPLQPNYTSTYPLQTLHTQPTTSTTPVIKIEIEDHKEEFLKLQQEVETLKAENQSLIARNHNLAREIFNLKQTSHVLRKDDAIKDTDSIDNDLLSQLAKESHRLSEKISDYADKIQKITSKYEIGENTMDIDQNAHENLDLTNKLRRLIEDNENVIGERDKLKDKVQTLLVDLENLSEENKALKRTVKLQRKRIEMLRIQGVSKTRNLKRLENSCFKLKSMFSKLKMARQNS